VRLALSILAAASGLILISLAEAKSPDTAKVQKGKQVYDYWCATCHAPSTANSKYPGTEALHAKYAGELPGTLALRTDLTADVVKFYVRNGVSVMPQFRKTEVDDAELDAIIAYLTRNNNP
jgi:mono/diheme cytochrome c family protein